MKIELHHIGKRYRGNWIFQDVNDTFESGQRYALLGPNGSGKSTLLRIIAGLQHSSQGTIRYHLGARSVKREHVFRHLAYCAPGMELIEEMTLREFLKFHFKFKKPIEGVTLSQIFEETGLTHAAGTLVRECSSGMKQRIKLAQAFFSDTPLLCLDEPCSNLDMEGVALYQKWLTTFTGGRLVVIASNDEREYPGAGRCIRMTDYQPSKQRRQPI